MGNNPRIRHVRAAEHALPYRVMFEELIAVGKTFSGMEAVFVPCGPEPKGSKDQRNLSGEEAAQQHIFDRISVVEQRYEDLAVSKRKRLYAPGDEAELRRIEAPLLELLHRVPRTALCLSGGGIRSAAYCLGVLQALARFRGRQGLPFLESSLPSALEQFDYLSTVSGGGYIGSWLTAWTYRVRQGPVDAYAAANKSSRNPDPAGAPPPLPHREAFHAVARGVAGDVDHTSGDPAQRPIRHLREYTSFLAPKLGLTLDAWTLAAIVLRNLLVNWIMIMPVILTLVAALQTVHYGIFVLTGFAAHHNDAMWWFAVGAFFLLAAGTAAVRMPSCPPEDRNPQWNSVLYVLLLFVLPLCLASLILLEVWLNLGTHWAASRETLLQRFFVAGFFAFLLVPVIRLWRGKETIRQEHKRPLYLLAGVGAAAITAAVLACALYATGEAISAVSVILPKPVAAASATSKTTTQAIAKPGSRAIVQAAARTPPKAVIDGSLFSVNLPALRSPDSFLRPLTQDADLSRSIGTEPPQTVGADLFVVFGLPVLWLLLLGGSSLFSGLLGIFEEDVDREWWARAGGLMMSVLVGWIAGEGMVIVAPILTQGAKHANELAFAALATGFAGALGGASTAGGLGAAASKAANISKIGRFLNKNGVLVPLLCSVALFIFGILLTDFEGMISSKLSVAPGMRIQAEICAASLLLSLLVNWAININIFSLHGMYRMRLMRAFLGASNTLRTPNPFTGFDDRDTVYEDKIGTGPGMPLHIINTTVNLVATSNLAWQQRKAEGFTISPLHCGGWRLGYVKTQGYGRKGGLSLSTAMAISGAAFNPNMGYHSSPLVMLMMTLFNVRLGWWLPNPRYRMGSLQALCNKEPEPAITGDSSAFATAEKSQDSQPLPSKFLEKKAPRLALGPLLREALGGTDDEAAFIELTDGGHFENLGVYEMVLRRARWVVVADASADPLCQLEDLGNALRKVEIDLGVPIVFKAGLHMRAGAMEDNLYCAVAEIRYDVVDPVDSAARGHLLYIKSGLTGNEPPDIAQYARTHPTFPHESTTNQFFNESQFESYRHLGHHAVRTILDTGDANGWAATAPDVAGCQPLVQALLAAAETYVGIRPRPQAATPAVALTKTIASPTVAKDQADI
jgi:hypothetical protein